MFVCNGLMLLRYTDLQVYRFAGNGLTLLRYTGLWLMV